MTRRFRAMTLAGLAATIVGMSITSAGPAAASELGTQYINNGTHCNKKSWIAFPMINYHYEFSSNNRAGYFLYYRAMSVVPSGPWSNPAVDTWWTVVKCSTGSR